MQLFNRSPEMELKWRGPGICKTPVELFDPKRRRTDAILCYAIKNTSPRQYSSACHPDLDRGLACTQMPSTCHSTTTRTSGALAQDMLPY